MFYSIRILQTNQVLDVISFSYNEFFVGKDDTLSFIIDERQAKLIDTGVRLVFYFKDIKKWEGYVTSIKYQHSAKVNRQVVCVSHFSDFMKCPLLYSLNYKKNKAGVFDYDFFSIMNNILYDHGFKDYLSLIYPKDKSWHKPPKLNPAIKIYDYSSVASNNAKLVSLEYSMFKRTGKSPFSADKTKVAGLQYGSKFDAKETIKAGTTLLDTFKRIIQFYSNKQGFIINEGGTLTVYYHKDNEKDVVSIEEDTILSLTFSKDITEVYRDNIAPILNKKNKISYNSYYVYRINGIPRGKIKTRAYNYKASVYESLNRDVLNDLTKAVQINITLKSLMTKETILTCGTIVNLTYGSLKGVFIIMSIKTSYLQTGVYTYNLILTSKDIFNA